MVIRAHRSPARPSVNYIVAQASPLARLDRAERSTTFSSSGTGARLAFGCGSELLCGDTTVRLNRYQNCGKPYQGRVSKQLDVVSI